MRRLLSLLLAAGLTVSAFGAVAADKLGYVSLERIMKESPQAKALGQKMKNEFAPRMAELDRAQKALNDKVAALDKNALTMSDTDRQKQQQDLSNANIDLQRKKRELNEDAELRKNEGFGVLQEKISKAVNTIAVAENYDLVVYSNVAYASKSVDITDKVMKAIGN